MGALSDKGGRGQRNREEIGALDLAREFRGPRLRRSCARLDKTAMLCRLLWHQGRTKFILNIHHPTSVDPIL